MDENQDILTQTLKNWPCRKCSKSNVSDILKKGGDIFFDYHCPDNPWDYPFVAFCDEKGPIYLIYQEKGHSEFKPVLVRASKYQDRWVTLFSYQKESGHMCPKCNTEMEAHTGTIIGGIYLSCPKCKHIKTIADFDKWRPTKYK